MNEDRIRTRYRDETDPLLRDVDLGDIAVILADIALSLKAIVRILPEMQR